MRSRQGNAGLMILTVTVIVWLVLPFGSQMILHLSAQQLLLQAGHYLDSQLPKAYLCLDPDALAMGEFVIDASQVDAFLRQQIEARMPVALKGRLAVQTIQLSNQAIPYDPEHWLEDSQPLSVPVVRCTAILNPPGIASVQLTRSAVLYQVPN